MLLAHDAGHLWTSVMYEELDTDVKGEYVGAGGNPISTVLEPVISLTCLSCHFVACTYVR